jgi:hypothetical protein
MKMYVNVNPQRKQLFYRQYIDDALQEAIEANNQKRRSILKILILNVVMCCAKKKLSLRGSCSDKGNSNSRIFVHLLELTSSWR